MYDIYINMSCVCIYIYIYIYILFTEHQISMITDNVDQEGNSSLDLDFQDEHKL